MYDYDTPVWIKSLQRRGTITERYYTGKKASYVVSLHSHADHMGNDYLTGSSDLRRADSCCDGCSRWLPEGSFIGGATARDGEYPHGLRFCFLCKREADRADLSFR